MTGAVRFHQGLEPLMESIQTVQQHPANPNDGDVDEIVASIVRNGMYRPVYAQSSTGHILAGNTTYAACLQLKATEIPVVWLDVTDVDALRILIGDNEIAALAHRNEAQLLQVIEQILEEDGLQGLLGTGLQVRDVENLRKLGEELIDATELENMIKVEEKPPHGLIHKCPECGFLF